MTHPDASLLRAVRDPEMLDYDLQVLRAMNGEEVPGLAWGAAMAVSAAWLKSRGYAEGTYTITQKGKDLLAAIEKETP